MSRTPQMPPISIDVEVGTFAGLTSQPTIYIRNWRPSRIMKGRLSVIPPHPRRKGTFDVAILSFNCEGNMTYSHGLPVQVYLFAYTLFSMTYHALICLAAILWKDRVDSRNSNSEEKFLWIFALFMY